MNSSGIIIGLRRFKVAFLPVVCAAAVTAASPPLLLSGDAAATSQQQLFLPQDSSSIINYSPVPVKPVSPGLTSGGYLLLPVDAKTQLVAGRMTYLPPLDEPFAFCRHLLYTQVTSSSL
jgi:hypothetical protein